MYIKLKYFVGMYLNSIYFLRTDSESQELFALENRRLTPKSHSNFYAHTQESLTHTQTQPYLYMFYRSQAPSQTHSKFDAHVKVSIYLLTTKFKRYVCMHLNSIYLPPSRTSHCLSPSPWKRDGYDQRFTRV